MIEYRVYYLVNSNSIVAGPFVSIDAAISAKGNFIAPFAALLQIAKSIIQAELI